MSTYTVLILIIISSLAASEFYLSNVNTYDGPLDFSCPPDATLQRVDSVHNNYYDDRKWSFGCMHASAAITGCHWSGYINNWDQPVDFRCDGDGFINGMKSIHSPYYGDRIWAYQCCTLTGHSTRNCYNTNYLNIFDRELTYTVPGSKLIHGASSVHSNYYQDRRFGFHVCDYGPI